MSLWKSWDFESPKIPWMFENFNEEYYEFEDEETNYDEWSKLVDSLWEKLKNEEFDELYSNLDIIYNENLENTLDSFELVIGNYIPFEWEEFSFENFEENPLIKFLVYARAMNLELPSKFREFLIANSKIEYKFSYTRFSILTLLWEKDLVDDILDRINVRWEEVYIEKALKTMEIMNILNKDKN